MLGELFVIVALAALALFIVWDSWRRPEGTTKTLRRSFSQRGYVPGAASREAGLFVLAAAFAAFGTFLLIAPPQRELNGRGAFLADLLYVWFGSLGMPIFLWLTALALLAMALSARRARLRSELPSNRG